jgi:hypothetical protein
MKRTFANVAGGGHNLPWFGERWRAARRQAWRHVKKETR